MLPRPIFSRGLAPIRNVPRAAARLQLAPAQYHHRPYSSSSKEPGPIASFYKTFTRPIAKVFLLAVFTYQLAYFGWVRLETGEIKADLQAEIDDLEARVAQLEKAKKQ